MTFLVHTPSPPLSTYVSALYCPTGEMPYPHEKVFPVPTTDLKINFGQPILAYRSLETEPFQVCKDSWCTGPSDSHHEIGWSRQGDFVGVTFTLGGASSVLGTWVSELHDRVVCLDALWGRLAAELRERLYEAKSASARFELLEQLLLERLRPEPTGLRTVRHVLSRIERGGSASVRELSAGAGVSQKHLIELFKRHVGATPKQVLRIRRFQRILDDIDATRPGTPELAWVDGTESNTERQIPPKDCAICGPRPSGDANRAVRSSGRRCSWTELAYRHGYADQSHFNKDFASFTGSAPGAYLALRSRVLAEEPTHATNVRLLSTGARWREAAFGEPRRVAYGR